MTNHMFKSIIILVFLIVSLFFVCIEIVDRDKIYYQYMSECIEKGRQANDCKILFTANKYKD